MGNFTVPVPVEAGSVIRASEGAVVIERERGGGEWVLHFPENAEDRVLACDTLIAAVTKIRESAPETVR